MLKIRLRRMGNRHRPFYRVVVSDQRKTPSAAALEEIGTYDPSRTPSHLRLDLDRVAHWVGNGAQPSPTVKKLIRRARTYDPVVEAQKAQEAAEKAAAEKAAAEAEKAAAEKAAAEQAAAEAAAAEKAAAEKAAAEKAAAEAAAAEEAPAATATAEAETAAAEGADAEPATESATESADEAAADTPTDAEKEG